MPREVRLRFMKALEAFTGLSSKSLFLICLVPSLHLIACIGISVFELAWAPLIYVDFPFSVVLVGLAWHYDSGFPVFGILGTLWWLLLSYAAVFFYRKLRQTPML
jgi:hypothetical protein